MSTLTFFLHGTRYHEEGRIKTVISALSEQCSSGGYVVNGPGGKARSGMAPTIPGTYKIDRVTGKKVPQRTVVPQKVTELAAAATGWGVEQNLVEMLMHVEKQHPLPDTINMVGFSRGADACLRFANLMYQFYPQIKINIIAIEPVPGPGRQGAETAQIIPPNVKHYVSTIALHENRAVFRPQDYSTLKPQDFESTQVECLPMPGHHGIHSRLSDKNPGTDDATELVQDIAIDRLKEWGTTFREDPQYPMKIVKEKRSEYEPRTDTDPVGLLRKYSTMICLLDNYGPFSKVRYAARHREDYTPILSHCFMNQQHLKLFAQQFPVTFQYMCDPDDKRKKENSNTELSEHPSVKDWLEKTFEAHPEKKSQVFFNPSKDRLDGNYLRVVMAIHAFRQNPLIGSEEKIAAKKLLQDCKNILNRSFVNKEDEIKGKVDAFILKYPNNKLTTQLKVRFEAKEPSLQERMIHELKAARNQSLLQRIIEGIESIVSSKREKYYTTVRSSLTDAINKISADPPKTQQEIVTILRETYKAIHDERLESGISKESRSEDILGKMITHAIRAPTPKSEPKASPEQVSEPRTSQQKK